MLPVENLGDCFLPLREVPARGLWLHPGSHFQTYSLRNHGQDCLRQLYWFMGLFVFKSPSPPCKWANSFLYFPPGGSQENAEHAGLRQLEHSPARALLGAERTGTPAARAGCWAGKRLTDASFSMWGWHSQSWLCQSPNSPAHLQLLSIRTRKGMGELFLFSPGT